MKILPVTDPSFKEYGQVLENYDTSALLKTLDENTPLPEGVGYVAEEPELMKLSSFLKEISDRAYGGMPVQLGWCNGHNYKMNCLEYHRDSEMNCGSTDFVLLVAKREEIGDDGRLDTSKVKAFKVPAGVLVEAYATTLHYAPCSAAKNQGFKVLIALPKGTNGPKPNIEVKNAEDEILWASNKWLLAHPDSDEAKQGAKVMLDGDNVDIESIL